MSRPMGKIPGIPFSTTLASWNINGEGARWMYREGYFNAANILCDALSVNSRDTKVWAIIYPIVFLFRHFVELYLKDFIDLANETGVVDFKNERKKLSHDLVKTYVMYKAVHEKIFGSDITELMEESCKDVVEFLGNLDDKGDRLRYPLDKKKQAQFPDAVGIDLPHLKKQIEVFKAFMHDAFDDLRKELDPDVNDEEMSSRTYYW